MFKLDLEKAEEPEIKLPTSAGSSKKQESSRIKIYFTDKLWKILKEMVTPGHLTYLLRNLYAGQVAPVITRHETKDWLQIGKGVGQCCILSQVYLTYT